MRGKRLYKSNDKKICGVCGGIAEYLNIDPTIVRIVFVLLVMFTGFGILPYIIAAILMDENPENETNYSKYNEKNSYSEDNIYESGKEPLRALFLMMKGLTLRGKIAWNEVKVIFEKGDSFEISFYSYRNILRHCGIKLEQIAPYLKIEKTNINRNELINKNHPLLKSCKIRELKSKISGDIKDEIVSL